MQRWRNRRNSTCCTASGVPSTLGRMTYATPPARTPSNSCNWQQSSLMRRPISSAAPSVGLTVSRQNDLLCERAEGLLKEKNFPDHPGCSVSPTLSERGAFTRRWNSMDGCDQTPTASYRRNSSTQSPGTASLPKRSNSGWLTMRGTSNRITPAKAKLVPYRARRHCHPQHGLSLRRGGFVKGTLSELRRWVNEPLKRWDPAVSHRGQAAEHSLRTTSGTRPPDIPYWRCRV